MPITLLVVKTPNQKLEDHTFSFETSRTVLQLKTYLQQQYPSNPVSRTSAKCFTRLLFISPFSNLFFQIPDEQRLIYSGKLLCDREKLEDFLRDLDSERVHTIHLVYVPKRSLSKDNMQKVSNFSLLLTWINFCENRV